MNKEIKLIKEIIIFQHKLNTTPDLAMDEVGAIIARDGLYNDRKYLNDLIEKLKETKQ